MQRCESPPNIDNRLALICLVPPHDGTAGAGAEAKRLLLAGVNRSLETQMETETRAIARMADAADGREGIAALSAKRPPAFE